jgi:hypothetical protein
MTDGPREQVLALVASYGPDVLDMTGTVETELHLHCPDQRDEVNALVVALRHGVVHYLLVLAENGQLSSADLPAQVGRLERDRRLFRPKSSDEARPKPVAPQQETSTMNQQVA